MSVRMSMSVEMTKEKKMTIETAKAIEKAKAIREQIRKMKINENSIIDGHVCQIRQNDINICKPYYMVWVDDKTIVRRCTLRTASAKLFEFLTKQGN